MSQNTSPLKVDVYYDFSCPWCYVGFLRCQEAIRRYNKPVELNEHVYMIDTGIDPHGEDYLSYNIKRWGSDSWVRSLRKSGEKDGAYFKNWKFWPNSFNAHRVMTYARSIHFENTLELNKRLFQMTYEEGKNISLIEELIALADDIGLPGVAEVLHSDQFKRDVIEEDDFAKDDLEIQGVPFFIINDKYYLEGANPPAAFVSVFNMIEKTDGENSKEA